MQRCLLIVALLAAPLNAAACPCSDDAGAGTSLSRADETYAAALVATSRRALGRFDVGGRYRSLADDEAETSEELLLRAALRLPQRLEWLFELGYASYRFHAGSTVVRHEGMGDAMLRARYGLLAEGMPHETPRWPALAVSALLRAPVGALSSSRATGYGSGGAQLGLGAWEAGAGVDLTRSGLDALDWFLGTEAAYRFRDHSLGRARRLGPRLDGWVGMRARANDAWSASMALRARVTGDVTLEGATLDGTGERLLSLLLGASFFDQPSGFRSSATLSLDPPLRLYGAGTTASVALGLALGYGGR